MSLLNHHQHHHHYNDKAMDKVHDEDNNGFVDLSDDAMLRMAMFLSPVDVYNLSLTCKRFHRPVAGSSSRNITNQSHKEIDNDDDDDDDDESRPPRRGGEALNALLCTKLLRVSLLHGLNQVLRNNKKTPGLSLDKMVDLFHHETTPRGSVAIAGSTIVQCVLGEIWDDSDMDIYCTPSAAPAVRSWLVREMGQLCQGMVETYGGMLPHDMGGAFLTHIHHVEHYCNCPKDKSLPVPVFEHEANIPPFDFERACQNGREINQVYFPRPWQQVFYNGSMQDLMDPLYRIQALPGHELPFNKRYTKDQYPSSFDLIVAKSDDSLSAVQGILNDFDLNICKASWNGANFIIPDPHYTFTRRSQIKPKWIALMSSYQANYNPPDSTTTTRAERFACIRFAMDQLPQEYSQVPTFEMTTAADDDDEDDNTNDSVRREIEELAFHNCICKQFARVHKYSKRGIEVMNAPPAWGDDDKILSSLGPRDTSQELRQLLSTVAQALVAERGAP